jgi:hypothetical protein
MRSASSAGNVNPESASWNMLPPFALSIGLEAHRRITVDQ